MNFYELGRSGLRLVDLPGYGFAFGDRAAAEQWQRLIESYLTAPGRPIKRTCLLVDARHGLKQSDRRMVDTFEKYATLPSSSSSSCVLIAPWVFSGFALHLILLHAHLFYL